MNTHGCSLYGYGGIECCADMDWHHIINYTMARGNAKVRAILAKNPPELMAWVCANHNRQRWADHRKARARLLEMRNRETQGQTKKTVDGLPWSVPMYCMTYDAMVS